MKNKKQPPLYALGSIPNNEEGLNFIKLMKSFLNKDRYELVVRGQHKKDHIHWTECHYSVRRDQAKTLRVYIKDKIEDQHPLHVVEKPTIDMEVYMQGIHAGILGCQTAIDDMMKQYKGEVSNGT